MKLNTEFMTKKRQYRSDQGRSPKQKESTYKIVGWSLLVIFVIITSLVIGNLLKSWEIF